MVQRTSAPVELRAQDTRRVSTPEIGVASLRANTPAVVGETDWRGDLIKGLMGVGQKVFGNMAEQAQMEAYLEGQAAVGQVESEDALEGNVFTRDWKVAGYRDTMGSLQLADASAALAKDMADLRTKPPEAMREYLAAQRKAITPNLASMSREARAKSFAKLMMHEQTAVRSHAEEHGKFILEQHAKAKSTAFNTELSILQQKQQAAMADASLGVDYRGQVEKVAGYIYADLYSDEKLIASGQRNAMVIQALEGTLAADNLTVYEYIDGTRMGPNGESILDSLSIDERNKLHKKYLEKRDGLAYLRDSQLNTAMAKTMQEFRDGTFQGTWDDVQAMTKELIMARILNSDEKVRAFQTPFFAMAGKADMTGAKAAAFISGKYGDLARMGASERDGADAVRAMFAKQAKAGAPTTIGAMVQNWADAGRNGMRTAYTELAKDISPAISQLLTADGKLHPENAQAFSAAMDVLDKAEYAGEATSFFLNGLPDEQKNTFQMIRSRMKHGGASIAEAVTYARQQEELLAGMSTQARAALAASKQGEIEKLVKERAEGQGHFMKAMRAVGGIFSEKIAATRATTPAEPSWFGNTAAASEYQQQYINVVSKRAAEIAAGAPRLTSEDVVTRAVADLARSTVPTKYGPLYASANTSVSRQLGLRGEYDNARIGEAISAVIKPKTVDGQVFITTGPRGEPMATFFDVDGVRQGTEIIGGSLIQKELDAADETKIKRNAAAYGPGLTIATKSGAAVTLRGANAAGVAEPLMFQFRQNLVQNEGVRATPYEDLSGKKLPDGSPVMTYGVGVTNQDPRYIPESIKQGKKNLTTQEITTTMEIASTDAAKAAKRVQDATGLTSDPAFLFLAEMAYQGGSGAITGTSGSEVVRQMMLGNAEAAVTAFKDTPVYTMQRGLDAPGRIKHYEKLIAQAVAQHKLKR